ncbi:MAG: thiol:disulfide interchange protein DsbA/DsbL [Betaproteobacteria bacterium]
MIRPDTALIAASAFLALTFAPAGFAEPTLDVEYKRINPPQPAAGKGVEVLEFFNYACSHCYDFEPLLKSWLKTQPKDVEFRYVPVVFNERMLPLAKTYYALEEMGLLEKLHDGVYEAIHQKRVNLADRAVMIQWIAGQGVDAKKFEATYDSFSVDSKAQRAGKLTRDYRITATPYVAVAGRYQTAPSLTLRADGNIDPRRFLQVLNDLVKMGRGGAK